MTIVLLPGMDGTGELFRPFCDAVRAQAPGADVRVVRYPADQPLGYEGSVEHARKSLPSDRKFVVLGESFSGPVSIFLATDPPPLLAGLILCATFVRNPHPVAVGVGKHAAFVPANMVPKILWKQAALNGCDDPEVEALMVQALESVPPAVLRARIDAMAKVDATGALASVKVPIMCLRANRDRTVPARATDALVAANPRMEVVELDAPHLILQAAPVESARAVLAFAERCSR